MKDMRAGFLEHRRHFGRYAQDPGGLTCIVKSSHRRKWADPDIGGEDDQIGLRLPLTSLILAN